MSKKDSITQIRDVRRAISKEHGNDPRRLAEYYIEKQKKHHDRMLKRAVSGRR